jgi:hypothetical protein
VLGFAFDAKKKETPSSGLWGGVILLYFYGE